MKNMTFKKITSQRLFLPIFCLALVLLVNIVTTPNFFAIEVRNGVLYGYLIDIINRASEQSSGQHRGVHHPMVPDA